MAKAKRSSYEASFARFIRITGGDGEPRPDVASRPKHDDERLGPSLFRVLLERCSLERLSLPGLFVGRSQLEAVSFTGSDLRLSTLCWNDFERCWFDGCDLTDSDLRASSFVGCDFSGADLSRCDLRRSEFRDCDFSDAVFSETVVAKDQEHMLNASAAQAAAISWRGSAGPEPPGG